MKMPSSLALPAKVLVNYMCEDEADKGLFREISLCSSEEIKRICVTTLELVDKAGQDLDGFKNWFQIHLARARAARWRDSMRSVLALTQDP